MKRLRDYWPILLVAIVSSMVTSALFIAYMPSRSEPQNIGAFPSGNASKSMDEVLPHSTAPIGENAIIAARKRVSPAVVYIDTVRTVSGPVMIPDFFREFFPGSIETPKREQRGTGSGFIIDPNGHILTNEHVIRGAHQLMVTLNDGRKFKGRLVGSDQKTDLAVVKIEAKDLPFVEMGDSDQLEPGQWVVAIGNPFGFHETVTFGIISALGRSLENPDESGYLIQTDAAINPGNSGGPLIDLSGRVVGINEAILSNAQGMGFAIPINLAKNHLDELIRKGKIDHPPVPWMGISMLPINDKLGAYLGINFKNGVYVEGVAKNSPAAKAGLQAGDVIKEIDRKVVDSPTDLAKLIKEMKVGQSIDLLVWRKSKLITLRVKLAARPQELE